MPQITLKYSPIISGIDVNVIFKKIHEALSTIADINACKSQLVPLEKWYVGNGDPRNVIIILELKLLPRADRTTEVKKKLMDKIYDILNEAFAPRLKELGLIGTPSIEIKTFEDFFSANSKLMFLSNQPQSRVETNLQNSNATHSQQFEHKDGLPPSTPSIPLNSKL